MIVLSDEVTNKAEIVKAIKIEMRTLNEDLQSQKDLKKRIIAYMRSYICGIDFQDTDDVYNKINSINAYIKKCDDNTLEVEKLVSSILDIKVNSQKMTLVQILETVKKYNEEYQDIYKAVASSSRKIMRALDVEEKTVQKEEEETKPQYKDNTLIISESDQRVYLPFTMNRIYEILQFDNTYSSVEEVIDKLYTRNIAYYKHAAKARFQEAYKLIIEKEHGTKKQAMDLGLELMFNTELHPAVITACKSIDELDVYLSCLEYNELDDFKFFKVEFDVPPAIGEKENAVYKFFRNIRSKKKVVSNEE